jgi:transposase-like protein
MTETQVEVITSMQRRRIWSRAEKERIVAAALEPGAVATVPGLPNQPRERAGYDLAAHQA